MISKFSIAAATVFFLGACAQGSASESITPEQNAAIRATCTSIMRLHAGEAEFDGCVADLSNTVALEIGNARTAHAYADCAAQGLKRKSVEFSRCVLDNENAEAGTPAPAGALALNVADVKPADSDPDGYFRAGSGLRYRREQYACAQMGLAPGSVSFIDCVNSLDTDLFRIANPNG